MFSRSLGKQGASITLCGEEIALFRDRRRVYAINDRCPHRGIPLAVARREFPGMITCIYHGWTFDLATGNLDVVLTDGPDSPICGKVQVRTYPVAERAGLIWVYPGDEPPPPVEQDMPPQLIAGGTIVGKVSRRRGNWRYASENGIDDGHGKFLHRHSLWTTFRMMAAWSKARMEPDGEWRWLIRVGERVEMADTYPRIGRWPAKRPWWKFKSKRPRIGIALPGWLLVKETDWTGFEVYVPSDADNYYAMLIGVLPDTGLRGLLFRLRYKLYIGPLFHGQFNEEDQWIIQKIRIPPERLYRPDVSITAWRTHCEKHARGATTAAPSPAEELVESGV
jgi:nitrite reductase/ring-hydroxylating ferredoxin subunit